MIRSAAALPAGLRAGLLAAFLLTSGACAGRRPPPPPEPVTDVEEGWSQEGVASWYGGKFHGRATASGETYDMEAMTAAHRRLPFGTVVEVEALETGRTARVRINDRGPFAKNRIIDLSRAAARRLGLLARGTARVRLEVKDVPRGCYEVQVGSFVRRESVRSARRNLQRAGEPVRTEAGPGDYTRVVAGPYPDLHRARSVRERFGGTVRRLCPETG